MRHVQLWDMRHETLWDMFNCAFWAHCWVHLGTTQDKLVSGSLTHNNTSHCLHIISPCLRRQCHVSVQNQQSESQKVRMSESHRCYIHLWCCFSPCIPSLLSGRVSGLLVYLVTICPFTETYWCKNVFNKYLIQCRLPSESSSLNILRWVSILRTYLCPLGGTISLEVTPPDLWGLDSLSTLNLRTSGNWARSETCLETMLLIF